MKSILLIALIGCSFICSVHSALSVEKKTAPKFSLGKLQQHFDDFKKQHNKIYKNQQNQDERFLSML